MIFLQKRLIDDTLTVSSPHLIKAPSSTTINSSMAPKAKRKESESNESSIDTNSSLETDRKTKKARAVIYQRQLKRKEMKAK